LIYISKFKRTFILNKKKQSSLANLDENESKLKLNKTKTKTSTKNEVDKTKKNETSSNSNNDYNGGTFSYFYSILPKQILGVPVDVIKDDLNDGRSQIASL
jgi:hypothetical protein